MSLTYSEVSKLVSGTPLFYHAGAGDFEVKANVVFVCHDADEDGPYMVVLVTEVISNPNSDADVKVNQEIRTNERELSLQA